MPNPPMPNPFQVVAVTEALRSLGSAWRHNWLDFDGRILRDQLNVLADALADPEPFDLHRWMMDQSICPENRIWAEDCSDRGEYVYTCSHLEDLEECWSVRGERMEDETNATS